MRPLGHKVYAIVNYRGSTIEPAVVDSYCRMIEGLEKSCYLSVTRYGAADFQGRRKELWRRARAMWRPCLRPAARHGSRRSLI